MSERDTFVSNKLPVLFTVMVYTITSPVSLILSLSVSITLAVLTTSIEGIGFIDTSVGSLVVFPSVSSPSSEVSLTLFVCPGEEAVAVAILEIEPLSAAASVIIKYAL